MEIYQVGGDTELSDYDKAFLEFDFKWIVYEYTYEDYEGNGELVGYDGEWLYCYTLGCCSCFSPLENGFLGGKQPYTVKLKPEDYIKTSNNILDEEYEAIQNKVKELLNL